MAEILNFPGNTAVHTPVEDVLTNAVAHNLKEVLVIGMTDDDDGDFCFVAASKGKVSDALYMMERARDFLMRVAKDRPEIR